MRKIGIRKGILLIVSTLLSAVVIVAGFIYFNYSDEIITKNINNYLNDRYDQISADNFDDSINNQTKYYSKKLRTSPVSINSEEGIQAGKKYFEDTEFSSMILTSSTEKLAYNRYEAKVSVLYANKYIEHDNFVNYVFAFSINKQGFNKYLFDNVEIISNTVTYINGGELHMHDGEVVVCDDEDHKHDETH
ncbi:MAG: hypothetical protein K0S76_2598 [Herbinix sp.]|jgi:hypothetical protein|nr:hypothetical protein [Herbinix sp.]